MLLRGCAACARRKLFSRPSHANAAAVCVAAVTAWKPTEAVQHSFKLVIAQLCGSFAGEMGSETIVVERQLLQGFKFCVRYVDSGLLWC